MLTLIIFYNMIVLALSSTLLKLPEIGYHRIIALSVLFCAILQYNIYDIKNYINYSNFNLFNDNFNLNLNSQFFNIFLLLLSSIIFISFTPLLNLSAKNNLIFLKYQNTEWLKRSKDYSLILLFSLLGASLILYSNNFLTLYLSLELLSFSSYILTAIFKKSSISIDAAIKYFLLGSLASSFILLGIGLIYFKFGFIDFQSLYILISNFDLYNNDNIIIVLGLIFILIGLLFKIGAAPLHFWTPDIYDGTPTAITKFLIIIPKISILITLALILKLFIELNMVRDIVLLFSIISLILGSIGGLGQYKIKRLLTFSTISHVGFILLSLVLSSYYLKGSISFYLYLVQYSLTSLTIFYILISLGFIYNYNRISQDLEYLKELKGLYFDHKYLTFSLCICLFSIMGMPPLIGFFAKIQILYAALATSEVFLALVCILSSTISAGYYLNLIKICFDKN